MLLGSKPVAHQSKTSDPIPVRILLSNSTIAGWVQSMGAERHTFRYTRSGAALQGSLATGTIPAARDDIGTHRSATALRMASCSSRA
jgi:hypothetical protein